MIPSRYRLRSLQIYDVGSLPIVPEDACCETCSNDCYKGKYKVCGAWELYEEDKPCPYVHDHICTADSCPEGCRLPRTCETCGYAPCALSESGYDDGEEDCWIPPYYFDRQDEDDCYWPHEEVIK